MGILSLKPSSFIINLGITLVLSGLIMVYVKQKFASYDRHFNTIDNHLKNLVSMVQKQSASLATSAVNWCSQPDSKLKSNTSGNSSLAAEGAVEAAKNAHEMFGGVDSDSKLNDKSLNKIIVSDNESESYTDDDDEEEDDESSSDSNTEENEKIEEIVLDNFKLNGDIKQIFITNEEPMHFLNNLMVLGNQKILGETLDLDDANESSIDSIEDLSESDSDDENDEKIDNELVDIESKLLCLTTETIIDNIENIESHTSVDDSLSTLIVNDEADNYDKEVRETETETEREELSPLNMSVGQLVEMSKNNLQDLCKSRNLSIKGSKKELIDRLLNK